MKLISSDELRVATGGVDPRTVDNWRKRGILGPDFGRRQGRGARVLYDHAEVIFLALLNRLAGSRPTLEEVAAEARASWQDIQEWAAEDGERTALYLIKARGMHAENTMVIRVALDADAVESARGQLLAVADAMGHAAAELVALDDRLVGFDVLHLSQLVSEVSFRFDGLAHAVDGEEAAEAGSLGRAVA